MIKVQHMNFILVGSLKFWMRLLKRRILVFMLDRFKTNYSVCQISTQGNVSFKNGHKKFSKYWRRRLCNTLKTYTGDTRTSFLYELTCTRNFHVCHSDLQQDFSCVSCSHASFLHETKHVLFDVLVQETCIKNLMQVSCTRITGITLDLIWSTAYRHGLHTWLRTLSYLRKYTNEQRNVTAWKAWHMNSTCRSWTLQYWIKEDKEEI